MQTLESLDQNTQPTVPETPELWWHMRTLNGEGFVVCEPAPKDWPTDRTKFFEHITYVTVGDASRGKASLQYAVQPGGLWLNMRVVTTIQGLAADDEAVVRIKAIKSGLVVP